MKQSDPILNFQDLFNRDFIESVPKFYIYTTKYLCNVLSVFLEAS